MMNVQLDIIEAQNAHFKLKTMVEPFEDVMKGMNGSKGKPREKYPTI